jgi:hypothetical protein
MNIIIGNSIQSNQIQRISKIIRDTERIVASQRGLTL